MRLAGYLSGFWLWNDSRVPGTLQGSYARGGTATKGVSVGGTDLHDGEGRVCVAWRSSQLLRSHSGMHSQTSSSTIKCLLPCFQRLPLWNGLAITIAAIIVRLLSAIEAVLLLFWLCRRVLCQQAVKPPLRVSGARDKSYQAFQINAKRDSPNLRLPQHCLPKSDACLCIKSSSFQSYSNARDKSLLWLHVMLKDRWRRAQCLCWIQMSAEIIPVIANWCCICL